MDALRTAGADGMASQATPPEYKDEAATAITPPKGFKAPPVGPTKVLDGDGARLSVVKRSIDELRDPFLGSRGDQEDGSRYTQGKAPVHWSSSRAAAITSQSSSLPAEHGVPFLARDKSRSNANKGGPSKDLETPGPSARREEVANFVRRRRIRKPFAFGIM